MSSLPTLQIPKDVIEPIIQAHITKAVIEALGGSKQILEQAIAHVLNLKVDENGRPRGYSSDKPWIEWAIGDVLQKAARAAIEEAMAGQSEALKKSIASQLTRRNSPLAKQLAEQLVLGVSSPETLKYRLTINCESR